MIMVNCSSRTSKLMVLLVCAFVVIITFQQQLSSGKFSLSKPILSELLPSLTTKHRNFNTTLFRLTPSDGRYVTNGKKYFNARLGNQLFKLAALIYVAHITNRQLFLTRYADRNIENTFLFTPVFEVERTVKVVDQYHESAAANFTSLMASTADIEFTGSDLSFDERVLSLRNRSVLSVGDLFNVTTLRLSSGYYQSWRYIEPITAELRRVLRPKPEIDNRVSQYFESVRPRNWTDYKRVGIHIRAGDTKNEGAQKGGYSIPSAAFYERALRQIISDGNNPDTVGHRQRLRRYQLFVTTDDVAWSQREINITALAADVIADHTRWSSDGSSHVQRGVEFDVVYSTNPDAGFDLIALSMCDVVVMSTGTFGWWAGWLSQKTTFYYKNWPKPGAEYLNSRFTRYDYFPPSWAGIDAPFVTFRKR